LTELANRFLFEQPGLKFLVELNSPQREFVQLLISAFFIHHLQMSTLIS